MALLNEILTWTESLPDWQRDAARRLMRNEDGIADADYEELYKLLKASNGIPTDGGLVAMPLSSIHLPGSISPGETVVLKTLRELKNVNRIPTDQTLAFNELGITVIYGGNGTGKSGYARVMKRACRARDQTEQVLPDANDLTAAGKVPSAKFDIDVAGSVEEVVWNRDSPSPDRLSTIGVFDSRCARSYLTAEQDVAYLPYGLDIVENLANQVLPKLTLMLDEELAAISVDAQPFDHLIGDTEVGKVVRDVSVKSNPATITTLATLVESDTKRIEELEMALKVADPLAKAREVQLSATRLKAFGEKIRKILNWVSDDAVVKLQTLDVGKVAAESSESEAAEALRAGETLLPGTGAQVWKLLFDAARRYSTEVAYPEQDFPNETKGSSCPLCQEPLSDAADQRLKRFDEYVKNDIAKTAEAERLKVFTAKEKIERADLQISNDQAMIDELRDLDDSAPGFIEAFEISLEERRNSMLTCLETHDWSKMPKLSESPRSLIRRLAAQQLKSFRTFVRAADEDKKRALTAEYSELVARQNLSKCLTPILSLVQRLKDKAALEKCRSSLRTRPISDKSKEFASMAVTDELKKALDREFQDLGIGHIQTKLRERSVRGKMLHQLLLDLPTANKLDDILSEGEQRAIALASFLAELSLANHRCGIVFDDPVSSLDHWRRRDVARRLVHEAKIRQVIVFTHDTSFLGQLCDEIETENVPRAMMFLEWRGQFPGCVNDGLPWDHQGYKARINALEQAQTSLAKSWPPYPNEQEANKMRVQYDRLRATLERVIQDVVFNGVVKRYRDWIRVDSLAEVVGFEQSEYEAIEKLHKRSCDVVSAHDPASAKAAPVPTAIELGKDINALKTVIEAIKNRRSLAKSVI